MRAQITHAQRQAAEVAENALFKLYLAQHEHQTLERIESYRAYALGHVLGARMMSHQLPGAIHERLCQVSDGLWGAFDQLRERARS